MSEVSGTQRTESERFLDLVLRNHLVREVVVRLEALDLPEWHVGAGCLAQTVWNLAHDLPATAGIDDYDIAYFDTDLSEHAESDIVAQVEQLLSDLPLRPDVKNQARVHLWYASHFGYEIRPHRSCGDAIASWPTTATAVGIRRQDGAKSVEAPFGTGDLLNLIVRPNRVQITPAIYERKVTRWSRLWPRLRILPWEQGVGVPGERCAA